jgi:heptosyltransferase-2
LRNLLHRAIRLLFWSHTSIIFQARLLALFAKLRQSAPDALSRNERILVIKLDRIGDFVLVTPFLRELRRAKPEAWITLVTSQTVSDLALHCPYVDELVIVPQTTPGLRSQLARWRAWQRIALKKLLPLDATLAILPRWDVDLYDAFSLLALCGARERVSYSVAVNPFKQRQNSGYDRCLTQAVDSTSARHEIEKNLALLTALGLAYQSTDMELWPVANADALLTRLLPNREKHRLVALCPLSAEEVKDWPLQRFLQVAEHFRHVPALTFVLIVGPE